MTTDEKLVYMANQIALNFARLGQDDAVAATADHIARFWDPGMKTRIFNCLLETGASLSATAAEAVRSLGAKTTEPR